MPMMTSRPAFAGSTVWFLGDATAAGMHASTMTFIASTSGTYQYLCPVPGHAENGMHGTLGPRPVKWCTRERRHPFD
jgi:plastocyanin